MAKEEVWETRSTRRTWCTNVGFEDGQKKATSQKMWIVSKNRSQPLGDSPTAAKNWVPPTISMVFLFFLTLHSLQDPSSQTRYWTCILGNKGMNWTTRKLLQWSVKWSESHSVVSDPLRSHGLYSPWNSPGQNTGVGSLSLLQGIFPTQGSNPGLPHGRRILYQLSHSLGEKYSSEPPETNATWLAP